MTDRGTTERCPECWTVMCEKFDYRPGPNPTVELAIPTGQFSCMKCGYDPASLSAPSAPQPEQNVLLTALEAIEHALHRDKGNYFKARKWLRDHGRYGDNLQGEDVLLEIATYSIREFKAAAPSEPVRELVEALRGREHTQAWYARHYGKLEDWARKRLPEPWRTEFFHCIANGTWGHDDVGEPYMSMVGKITPSGYFVMDDAYKQILHNQTTRAEQAEFKLAEAERVLARYQK